MRPRRAWRAGLTLAVAGMLSAAWPAPGSATVTAAAQPGCPAAAGLGTRMPVLLVHGYLQGPQSWSAGGTHSMIAAISAISGVKVVPPFSYFQENTSWVTNPRIGPALASEITCLATTSRSNGGPGKVILVGYSMGGLAIRCALDSRCAPDAAQSSQVALVVTLGTPNTGSELLHAHTQNKIHAKANGYLSTAIGYLSTIMTSACDAQTACRDTWGIVANRGARAMATGSEQLKTLAPIPASIRVYALAGKITVTDTMFGIPLASWDIGDGVVLEQSALADAPAPGATQGPHTGPGSGQQTIPCGHVTLAALPLFGTAVNIQPTCSHLTEQTSPRWQAAVTAAIKTAAGHAPRLIDWRNTSYSTTCGGNRQRVTVTVRNGKGHYVFFNQPYNDYLDLYVQGVARLGAGASSATAVLLLCEPQPSNFFVTEIQLFTAAGQQIGPALTAPDLLHAYPPYFDGKPFAFSNGTLQTGAEYYTSCHACGTVPYLLTWRWTGSTLKLVTAVRQ